MSSIISVDNFSLSFEGYLINITPGFFLLCANTHSPKSLSSVINIALFLA